MQVPGIHKFPRMPRATAKVAVRGRCCNKQQHNQQRVLLVVRRRHRRPWQWYLPGWSALIPPLSNRFSCVLLHVRIYGTLLLPNREDHQNLPSENQDHHPHVVVFGALSTSASSIANFTTLNPNPLLRLWSPYNLYSNRYSKNH